MSINLDKMYRSYVLERIYLPVPITYGVDQLSHLGVFKIQTSGLLVVYY
jgi:hypothetical protein